MESLKDKTLSGIFWSIINTLSIQGTQFYIGIVLARLLSPEEFGTVSLMTIFISVSTLFINSGFGSALIKKQDCTQQDYSTVFYYNLLIAGVCYLIIFLISGWIADFYKQPILKDLIRVFGFVLIIDSFSMIQVTLATKRIDFKIIAKVSLVAGIISGIVAIILAYIGYGIWSLVIRALCSSLISSCLYWIWNKWRPSLTFNTASFKEMFAFGSKLLGSSIVAKVFEGMNAVVIGKYISVAELGYFMRAESLKNLPVQNFSSIISKVSYPALAKLTHDSTALKTGYKKLMIMTMFISFFFMFLLAAIAKSLVLILLTEKWRFSIGYLQLLCFVGVLYPMHSLNMNILILKGKTGRYFKLTVVKQMLMIPGLVIAVFIGIKGMIYYMILNGVLNYFINSSSSADLMNYGIREQLLDILPPLFVTGAAGILSFCITIFPLNDYVMLLTQILVFFVAALVIAELSQLKAYILLKEMVFSRIGIFNKK